MTNRLEMKKIVIVISFIAFCLAGAIYTNRFFSEEVIQQQTAKLAQEIALIKREIVRGRTDLNDYSQASNLRVLLAQDERLTLLDETGVIIYDSSHENKATGQRSTRPEIEAILKDKKNQGTALRESATLNQKMLYVAQPILINGETVGVLRLSEVYAGFSASIRRFQRVVFVSFLLLVSALVALLLYFIRQTNEPLRFILPALRQAIEHPEKQQELDTGSPEWNQLYQSVNHLMRETNQLYYQQLFNEEKLHFLLESLNIGVFILNSELEVVSVNPMMGELFPQKTKEPQPVSYRQWFNHQEMSELIEAIKASGVELQHELHLSEPQARDLNVVLRILQPDNQQGIEYVGVIYDITAIRQMELMHQDFISNISHELKTPTTSIIGFTETLLGGAMAEPEVAEEFLEIIQLEGKRLESLIQNILLLLRTETSLGEKDSIAVSPISIIEEELERYQGLIQAKELKVTFGWDELITWEVPADYFQPIVKNLLENAVNYTEKAGQIHLSLREKNNQLVFSVRDTGVGIAAVDQQRIFERFYRVSKSRQRNSGGTGLGLSIVSHYATLLQGKLSLESQLGEGTTVTLVL